MRIAVILATIALVALFIFNPEMETFQQFVETHSERLLEREFGDSTLGRALSGVAGSLAGSYVDRITERDNYLVFSIYTIDLDGDRGDEEEWRFLGMAGQFLELEQPASLQEDDE